MHGRSFSGIKVLISCSLSISLTSPTHGTRDPHRSPGCEHLHEPPHSCFVGWNLALGPVSECQGNIRYPLYSVRYLIALPGEDQGKDPVAQQCQLANYKQPDTLKPFPKHSRRLGTPVAAKSGNNSRRGDRDVCHLRPSRPWLGGLLTLVYRTVVECRSNDSASVKE